MERLTTKSSILFIVHSLGDRLLSSASTGKNCVLSIRFSDPSPVLDKNRAPMGPEILSSTGAGVCRKAPKAFSDSSSVLDKFLSVTTLFSDHEGSAGTNAVRLWGICP